MSDFEEEKYGDEFDVDGSGSLRNSLEENSSRAVGRLYETVRSGINSIGESVSQYFDSSSLGNSLKTAGVILSMSIMGSCHSIEPVEKNYTPEKESEVVWDNYSRAYPNIDSSEPFFRKETEEEDENPSELFSVIIGGSTGYRNEKNISIAYEFLKDQGDTIIIDGPEREYDYPVDYEITSENIRNAFDEVSDEIDDNDRLFVYITGHGGRKKVRHKGDIEKRSTIGIKNRSGFASHELEEEIDDMDFDRSIVYATTCYSGGVAERLAGENIIGISSARDNRKAWGDEMERAFFRRLQESKEMGNPERRLNLRELFEYAKNRDIHVTLEGYRQSITESLPEDLPYREGIKSEIINTVLKKSHKPKMFLPEDTDASEIILTAERSPFPDLSSSR